MSSIYATGTYSDIKTPAKAILSINRNSEYSTGKEKLDAFGKQYHFFLTKKDPKSYRYVTNLNKILIGKLGFFDNLVYSILHFFSSFSDASEWSFTVDVCKKYLEKTKSDSSQDAVRARSWSDPTPLESQQRQPPRARSSSTPSRRSAITSLDGYNPFSIHNSGIAPSSEKQPDDSLIPSDFRDTLSRRGRALRGDAYTPHPWEGE
ncbi:MAG: hypothetical protein JXA94_05390 [Parachlamydiales bacterium]|nr:hypothetical protein [Parachlamydiales bacterium]